jgi:tetratricopeptide (TPR) repeat protein
MAFGFGFNKQKVLSAAEKFVQQGKLQNAIAEYEKILKNDPKDLTVTNTVGDLYARLGDTDKAVGCFKNVGDAYAAQGFTVKGIAMYKKITKLKPSLDGVLKLAELYTQQGLFNDARAQYLQVAEEFMRAGELEQAVRIFQKILEMDPENVPMRVRLAEVYIRLGKKNEAWEIFSAAAESLRARGSLAAAEDILQRMLALDPGNSYVLLLRARTALEADDAKSAIQYFEKVGDLDTHPDGMRDLLKAYLSVGKLNDAAPLADKLLTVHNEMDGILAMADAYMHNGGYQQALNIIQEHADRMLAADSNKVLTHLHTLISHVRENTAALETLIELFNKAGDTSHISEVKELLAHASVQSGALSKAAELYQSLAALEPQNPMHMKNYEQVLERMGGTTGARLITAEEGAVMVDELEATAPLVEQHYGDADSVAIRAALTDADLFLSYNMPAKAVVPLLSVLSRAPHDVRLNQRLAALHTRGERFQDAAACCRVLESVYSEAGHPDEAIRYGELATRYEERTSAVPHTDVEDADMAQAAPWPMQSEAAIAEPEFAVAEETPETHEIHTHSTGAVAEQDLSSQWEEELSVESSSAAPIGTSSREIEADAVDHAGLAQALAEAVEETRFYVEHAMLDQARAALTKVKALTSDSTIIDGLRSEIEAAAVAPAAAEDEVEVSSDSVDAEEIPTFEISDSSSPENETIGGLVADLESSLGNGFLPEMSPVEAEPEPVMQALETSHQDHGDGTELGTMVSDLEEALGDGFMEESLEPPATSAPSPETRAWPAAKSIPVPNHGLEPAFQAPITTTPVIAATAAVAPVSAGAAAAAQPALAPGSGLSYRPSKIRPLASDPAPAQAVASVDLGEMFGELKQELEEDVASTDEDPETHYNLGVAFREMGLLDEAIGELQKVCQAIERGLPVPHIMQTYTWLAQCFLDKGVPEAAIRWYESALKLKDLDQETRTALHYELASAFELANDKPAALKHFMEVYGSNIDYRDVAERIKALKS